MFALLAGTEVCQIEKRLKEKLTWLINYQEKLFCWQQMVQMTRGTERQLKLFGLTQQSETKLVQELALLKISDSLEPFKQKILNYLKGEMIGLQDNRTILATSDVLESIFSKYKRFSARCPLRDFRQMLLLIPLFTISLTPTFVKQALETFRGLDLSEWLFQVFGQSVLSKRKDVFSPSIDDLKTA